MKATGIPKKWSIEEIRTKEAPGDTLQQFSRGGAVRGVLGKYATEKLGR